MRLTNFVLAGLVLAVSACRGDAEIKCSSGGDYQTATTAPRVQVPEDLDNLDALKEIPLPEASPQAPGSAGQECIEQPPDIGRGG